MWLRGAVRPLVAADTYRRWAYLVLGGVVFVPFALATLVVLSLVLEDGAPNPDVGTGVIGLLAFAVAAGLGASTALLPGVRQQQVGFARWLLGGPLANDPVGPTGPMRARATAWMAFHLVVGFLISIATMFLLSEAAMLALVLLTAVPETMFPPTAWLLEQVAVPGVRRLVGPALGVVIVLALVYLVFGVGTGAARLAPRLLGPTPRDRLAAAQARADDLVNRNRLAAELHDSIGHTLSVVALQAAAASRLVDHDPSSAREATEAIAKQARAAAAELDHVLGVLREERRTASPQRELSDLPALVEASRSTGVELELIQAGPLEDVPPVVSREAYRLCQEALTNALRHGAAGGPIVVNVEVVEDSLRIEVVNALAERRRRAGGGRGLTNLRDRAGLLGGDVSATTDNGSWRLVARIPLAVQG
jgi:signal transduction histidine kinase